MTYISSIVCYKVFNEEKNYREDFLTKQKMKKWMLIIDKVIPSSVFISKFNNREETIELQQANQKARVQFNVNTSEQFNSFIDHIFFDKNSDLSALSHKNSSPPNNLKTKIRSYIEKEKLEMLGPSQKKQPVSRNSFLGAIPLNLQQKLSNTSSSQKINNTISPFNAVSFETQKTQGNSLKKQRKGSTILPSIFMNKPQSKRITSNSKRNSSIGASTTQNFKDDHSNSLKNNTLPSNNNNKFKNQLNELKTLQEDLLSNPSDNLSPIPRKQKRWQPLKNTGTLNSSQEQEKNEASPNGNIVVINNLFKGYYYKTGVTELSSYDIKICSYFIDEIYIIIIVEQESQEGRLVKERNKLRDYQICSNKFANQLSQTSRQIFNQLRKQQINFINTDVQSQFKSQNMKSINFCFRMINDIDNFITNTDQFISFLTESNIKEVNVQALIDNISRVLSNLREEKQVKQVIFNQMKNKTIMTSSKHLTQLLYNIFNLSIQLCAGSGLVQIEIKESMKGNFSQYLELSVRHSLKEKENFSILNLTDKQRIVLDVSKKLLEVISPYSKFFIKQRQSFYTKITFFLYIDLSNLNKLLKKKQSITQSYSLQSSLAENRLIEQEDCQSDELSILEQIDPQVPPLTLSLAPNNNSKNQNEKNMIDMENFLNIDNNSNLASNLLKNQRFDFEINSINNNAQIEQYQEAKKSSIEKDYQLDYLLDRDQSKNSFSPSITKMNSKYFVGEEENQMSQINLITDTIKEMGSPFFDNNILFNSSPFSRVSKNISCDEEEEEESESSLEENKQVQGSKASKKPFLKTVKSLNQVYNKRLSLQSHNQQKQRSFSIKIDSTATSSPLAQYQESQSKQNSLNNHEIRNKKNCSIKIEEIDKKEDNTKEMKNSNPSQSIKGED